MNLQSSKRCVSIVFSVTFLLLATALAQKPPAPSAAGATKAPDEIHQIWTANVTAMLEKPIPTSSNDSYNMGEELLVPLHAAFIRQDAEWEKEFAEHFHRLVVTRPTLTDVVTSRLQYLYLASQFIVLAKNSGRTDLIPEGLPDLLFRELDDMWFRTPAPTWQHPPFVGMRERVVYKLDHRNLGKSYFRGILDQDFYAFAIAADLRNYYGQERAPGEKTINDVLAVAERTNRQEIVRNSSGGWVFQPGVWTDHPDYQFAGNSRAMPGMRPAAVRGIGWDSSHFGRWAFFYRSLMDAYPPGSPQNRFYVDLENGLNTQFITRILVPPSADFPCPRLNNYMDGTNGPFRWGYATLGPNNGYGPYQLSSALPIGWWAFLESDQSRSLFRKLADQYPWPEQCLDLYLGPPGAGHVRTKSELDPNSPHMKFLYLLVRLSADL